ncbi:MAG TPA: HlyD family efflux transporter periplasmic adaptor subunit [Acetobacteraceae bacterium]|nr:HlyD family efflux transporter periplasmic adaptor subunit [Acetobacteraceae bacterium]
MAGLVLLFAALAGLQLWRAWLHPITVHVAGTASTVPAQVFGLGTVGARVQSNVGFKVAGTLVALHADAGDHVAAGSVLAQLDDRDVLAQRASAHAGVQQAQANIGKATADVASAEASLFNAEQVSRRRTALARSGVVSVEVAQTNDAAMRVARANVAVAQSEVAVAQAALAAAQAQEEYATVAADNDTLRAPYDAWVVSRNLQLGSMPVPGQSVFTLVDPTTIWVLGYVDERLAGRVAVGQAATIVLRSDPSRALPGHVARIEIQSDPVNQERLVEVGFDQVPPDIHLAEQAEMFITTDTLRRAVLVPPLAVTHRTGAEGMVWTVESGRLQQRKVTFGPDLLDGRLPIVAGLPDDVPVVISPTAGLIAGRAAVVAQDAGR